MFPKPAIHDRLGKFILVDLYTDGTDAASLENQKLQETKFQTVAIPHYAIVRPDETVIAGFEGLTKNESEFVTFLDRGLPASVAAATAPDTLQRQIVRLREPALSATARALPHPASRTP